MGNFDVMNNAPYHFIVAGVTLAVFLLATFVANEGIKRKLTMALHVLFLLVVASGVYFWFRVDFSIPLLIKSVGGLALFWIMHSIVKKPANWIFWALFVVTAAVGLFLAFFYI